MTKMLKIKESVLFGNLVIGDWELFGIWNLVLGD